MFSHQYGDIQANIYSVSIRFQEELFWDFAFTDRGLGIEGLSHTKPEEHTIEYSWSDIGQLS